ncbi:MAG: hypothetical protein NTZ97_02915 [Candidatus Moranbacteria bacterium]|nr:hypothetical protein [Candidatus Moranbacteria bacterium]
MNKKIFPKDYHLMFRVKNRASFLVSEFLLSGPLSIGDALIVNRGKFWVFYLYNTKEARKKIKKTASKLFLKKINFQKYFLDFKKHKKIFPKISNKYLQKSPQINLKEFKELVENLKDFWKLYGFTEYVFIDSISDKFENKIFKENLKK